MDLGPVEKDAQPHKIGVFVRSTRELRQTRNAVKQGGIPATERSDKIEITPGKLSIGIMHLAKGLEFRLDCCSVRKTQTAIVTPNVAGAGARYVKEMALTVVHFFEIGIIGDILDRVASDGFQT